MCLWATDQHSILGELQDNSGWSATYRIRWVSLVLAPSRIPAHMCMYGEWGISLAFLQEEPDPAGPHEAWHGSLEEGRLGGGIIAAALTS